MIGDQRGHPCRGGLLHARIRSRPEMSTETWHNSLAARGMASAIGIEIRELTCDRVVATMPVDDRTRQPFGILHGGASMALAETVASIGATACIDREQFVA